MTRNPHRLLIMLALAASLAALASCCPCTKTAAQPSPATSQVLVKFKPGTSAARIAHIASELGLLEAGSPLPEYHLFRTVSPQAARHALERLKGLPEVESAQPDHRYRPAR